MAYLNIFTGFKIFSETIMRNFIPALLLTQGRNTPAELTSGALCVKIAFSQKPDTFLFSLYLVNIFFCPIAVAHVTSMQ